MAVLPSAEMGATTRRPWSHRWAAAQGSMITEYAMLLVFISVAAIVGMVVLGGGMNSLWRGVGEAGSQPIQAGTMGTGTT